MVRLMRRPWAVTVMGPDGTRVTCVARAWTRLGAEIKAAGRGERGRRPVEVIRTGCSRLG